MDAGARAVRLPAALRAAAVGVGVYLADVAVSRAQRQAADAEMGFAGMS